MRLLSFLAPDEGAVRVGLLSHDEARVVDLTAVGVEDVFDALARVGQLRRVAGHLLHAPGALALPAASVRPLACVPVARAVWRAPSSAAGPGSGRPAGARGRSPLEYVDPAPMLGTGDRVESAGALAELAFGVGCVMAGARAGSGPAELEGAIAGFCLAIRWAAPAAPGLVRRGAALGPWLVTTDELAHRRTGPAAYDLGLALAVNGAEHYRGSWEELAPGLVEVLTAAAGAFTLRAGDVLCAPRAAVTSVGPGDDVVLHSERLGVLRLRVKPAARDSVAKGE